MFISQEHNQSRFLRGQFGTPLYIQQLSYKQATSIHLTVQPSGHLVTWWVKGSLFCSQMSSQHRLRVPEIPPPDAVYVSVIVWLCSHLTWQDYWWGQCFLFPVSEHECTQGSRLLLSRREQTAKAHMPEGRVCVKNGGERLGTEDALPDLCPFARGQPWDRQAQESTWQWKGWWRQPVQSFLSDFPTSSSPCPIPAVFFSSSQ